ncbi:MAG: molybdenum cofactor biosynthesis protein [Euryarchaeota archaeon RBG_16_68_12]|nr:MAG: molybdenum cofactor biosynthesis protein [Euryarchaeota archaeon RBG_16_68_12]
MAAVEAHKAHAPKRVTCGVITVSDTRTEATDESGALLKRILTDAGHALAFYAIVKDEASPILDAVERALGACDAILTNGGTGLSPRDVTIETLEPKLDKVLPGFGELFRSLSYGEIGSAAMLSRALAGVYRGRLLFCLPGSPAAVELAARSLVLPELGHAVGVMKG